MEAKYERNVALAVSTHSKRLLEIIPIPSDDILEPGSIHHPMS